jgi:hypothetical protein
MLENVSDFYMLIWGYAQLYDGGIVIHGPIQRIIGNPPHTFWEERDESITHVKKYQ